MSFYLRSVIHEEIERAKFLKTQIIFPVKYPELTGLASRCVNILDDQIHILKDMIEHSENYAERSAWRILRDAYRRINMTEQWGIPPLYHQSKEIGLLNKMVFDIHKEINLPLEHPSIACFSTQYYYTTPLVDVIFVPLSESAFLLHLPDIYHEIGHYVSKNKTELKLQMIGDKYAEVYDMVTEYFVETILKKHRERGPEATMLKIQNFCTNWQKNWIEEFFCDLFAIFLVGPAYAWSHIHLVTKNHPEIYGISSFNEQEHPADEARMSVMLIALRSSGFEEESVEIEEEWNRIRLYWGEPSVDFNYAYPCELLEQIIKLFYEGFRSSQLNMITKSNDESDSIRNLLNTAWKNFWKLEPEEFRAWEAKQIDGLNIKYFERPVNNVK